MIDIKKYEELRVQLEIEEHIAETIYEKIPSGLDYYGFEKFTRETYSKVNSLERQIRMVMPYELEDLPTYGDKMTLKAFMSCVEGGGFINSDGYGHYVKDGKMTNITIHPSDLKYKSIRKDFDEIIWFNK